MRRLKTVPTLALVLALTASAAHADEAANASENAWWPTGERDNPHYVELGFGIGGATASEVPRDSTFIGLAPVAELRVGRFLNPYLAVEVAGRTTSVQTGGLFTDNRSDFSRQNLSLGTRAAFPTYASPFLGASVGYQHATGSWVNGTGACLFSCDDGPEGVVAGRIETNGMTASAEVGLQVAYGNLTASFQMSFDRWLYATSDLDTSVHGEPANPDADVPEEPTFFSQAGTSGGVRVGLRF